MKELSIEEKAKRYDEALTKARNIVNSINVGLIGKDSFEAVFPELKESEDEKIRQKLIKLVKMSSEVGGFALHKWEADEMLAWLEKQGEQKPVFEMITPEESLGIDSDTYNKIVDECIYGEQKPADKIEPKFKVGDWVVKGDTIAQILDIQEQYYIGLDIDGNDFTSSRFLPDDKIHLWTIADAKDGDVLLSPSTPEGDKECPFIFKEIDKNGIVRFHAALLQSDSIKIADGITNVMGYASAGYHTPATKEQCDLLFSKMKEAGYEWNAEKKELKKIIDEKQICSKEQREKESLSEIENRIINFAMQFHDNRMKPEAEWEDEVKMLRDNIPFFSKIDTWNKEDEKIFLHVINDLKFLKDTISIDPNYAVNITDIEREINWFESLKDRVQSQTKQDWSERDELMLEESIGFIKSSPYPYAGDTLRGEISKTEAEDWLKSLKNRVLPQPKQEWSDDDEQYLLVCKNALVKYQVSDKWDATIISQWLEKKLKSLRPQNTWKPSDEQMKALRLLNLISGISYVGQKQELIDLYNDLKKLKGE